MTFNPVLSRELRQRFRRGRAPVFFTLWLVIVGVIAYLIFLAGRSYAQSFGFFGVGAFASSAALGKMMFELTAVFIMTAVLFVVPGVMSLSIVGERDRLTLKLLQMSQLRPLQIILGKLSSGLAYVVLLIVAAGPVLLLPVALGGVKVSDALAALGITLLTAVTLGAISVWTSARAKTTRGAVGGAYLWAFVLAAGTMILLVAEVILIQPNDLRGGGEDGREFYSVWANPYVALVSAVSEPAEPDGGVIFGTPFTAAGELLAVRQGERRFPGVGPVDVSFGGVAIEEGFIVEEGPPGEEPIRGPIWIRSVLIYVAIIVVATWLAARAVAAPAPPRIAVRRPSAKAPTEASDAVA